MANYARYRTVAEERLRERLGDSAPYYYIEIQAARCAAIQELAEAIAADGCVLPDGKTSPFVAEMARWIRGFRTAERTRLHR